MVQDAEKYKDEDEKLRKQVDASNALENFCYRVKKTLSEERLKDKFSDEDKVVAKMPVESHLNLINYAGLALFQSEWFDFCEKS